MKAMMDLHYYRAALLSFIGATIANKHILHAADIDADSVRRRVTSSPDSQVRRA